MIARRTGFALIATLAMSAATLLVPGGALANGVAPTADVTGPIPVTATSYPFLATDIDLAKFGYVEEEYFIEGNAFRYDTTGPLNQTATRVETGGPQSNGSWPFKTRIIVRRPANDADFNGVVVAEWMNVTAFHDLEANWFGDPYYLLKNGYAFVGVSAQAAGVRRLVSDVMPYKLPEKQPLPPFNPERYAGLTVDANGQLTNDVLSYDIYAAAIKAIRGQANGSDPLGSLRTPSMVIASGESQSCGRLANQYNKIEPIQNLIDAWYLSVCTTQLRDDRPQEKAIRILTETENASPATEPDTDAYRQWEVAGASHLPRSAFENWNGVVSRDREPQIIQCNKFPLSTVEWPFTQNRAIAALVDWVGDGTLPPTAPRGQYNDSNRLVRDQYGNALGGIRYPALQVPVAEYLGTNTPANLLILLNQFCGLLGSTTYFPVEDVNAIYPDHPSYVDQVTQSAQALLAQDFILAEDVPRLIANAEAFPRLRPAAPAPATTWSNGRVPFAVSATTAPETTFEFQRRAAGTEAEWSPTGPPVSVARLKNEPQGNWQYRVRTQTVIPATNISDPETVTTPWSDPSGATSKVDRTGPRVTLRCPTRIRSGASFACTVRTFDALSGLRGPTVRKVERRAGTGATVKVRVTVSDRAGNSTTRVLKRTLIG